MFSYALVSRMALEHEKHDAGRRLRLSPLLGHVSVPCWFHFWFDYVHSGSAGLRLTLLDALTCRSSAFAGRMAVATRPSPTAAGFAAPARQLHHTVMAAQVPQHPTAVNLLLHHVSIALAVATPLYAAFQRLHGPSWWAVARWNGCPRVDGHMCCHGAQAAPTHKGHQGESGADITPQNGTTSISLTEGFKPFEEVRPSTVSIFRHSNPNVGQRHLYLPDRGLQAL
jgi:hypothetical protein